MTKSYCELFYNVVCLIVGIVWAYLKYIFELFRKPALKSLDNDIILVTGSGNGLGRAMCMYLAETCPKATLVCWDVNHIDNRSTVDTLKSMGIRAFGYEVDVSDRTRIAKCAVMVKKEVGDVTVVVNNAGICHKLDPFLNLDPKSFEKLLQVNFLSHCWILAEFLPKMKEKNRGHVVSICSFSGNFGSKNVSLYGASKFAIRGLIESLSWEMEAANIKFTTIFPGVIAATNLTRGWEWVGSVPYPLKMLEVKEVAMEVVNAFRRNEELVFLPRGGSRLLTLLSNILIPDARKLMLRFLDGEFVMRE